MYIYKNSKCLKWRIPKCTRMATHQSSSNQILRPQIEVTTWEPYSPWSQRNSLLKSEPRTYNIPPALVETWLHPIPESRGMVWLLRKSRGEKDNKYVNTQNRNTCETAGLKLVEIVEALNCSKRADMIPPSVQLLQMCLKQKLQLQHSQCCPLTNNSPLFTRGMLSVS